MKLLSVFGEKQYICILYIHLEQLDLSNNNISGSLSADFGKMENLGYITMLNNKEFGGSIPAAVKAHANWTTWKAEQYIFPQQDGYGLR